MIPQGTNTGNSVPLDDEATHSFAKDQLKAIVERIECLDEEKKCLCVCRASALGRPSFTYLRLKKSMSFPDLSERRRKEKCFPVEPRRFLISRLTLDEAGAHAGRWDKIADAVGLGRGIGSQADLQSLSKKFRFQTETLPNFVGCLSVVISQTTLGQGRCVDISPISQNNPRTAAKYVSMNSISLNS
jgi:hypothetical protein